MTDFACTLLVDRRGWVLLQERDEHAEIAPGRWAASGGHVEPGETFLQAAVRELAEETGLEIEPAELRLVGVYDIHHVERASDDRMALYTGATAATDADIVLGEGRQIVFVDPDSILELPLSDSARAVLPDFLTSEAYAELRP
jgi:8-oxo-dGTP pyrophosphatase MutT (NUDIX family)